MNKFSDSLGLMIFISHDKFFPLDACNSQIKHIELFAVRIFPNKPYPSDRQRQQCRQSHVKNSHDDASTMSTI